MKPYNYTFYSKSTRAKQMGNINLAPVRHLELLPIKNIDDAKKLYKELYG